MILLLGLGLLCSFNVVQARLKVPFGEKEVLVKVADLPDTPEFETGEGSGQYFDLGRMHTEYNVLWLPLYIVQEPKLVGIGQAKDVYYDISDEELNQILKASNLDKEKLLGLDFFTKYGGKLVAALLIILIIYGYLPRRPNKVVPKNV